MRGKKPLNERQLNDAVAALIASTKRKNRNLTPLQVADKIEVAYQGIGSLKQVADAIGLSYEMLRQIYSVKKCTPDVKQLVRQGKLASFDILYRLSKLPERDQLPVAKAVVAGDLSSDDVRGIVSLRKDFPSFAPSKIIERIRASRNIKEYIAYFEMPDRKMAVGSLRRRFEDVVGKDGVRSLKVEGQLGTLRLNGAGRKRLQAAAGKANLTKRKFLDRLIAGGAK